MIPLSIYKSLTVLFGSILFYLLLRRKIIPRLEYLARCTTNDLDDRLVYFIKQFLGIVILFCSITFLLGINDIKISPLLAGAGIVGASLGFAAKETIADILAGIFLIADQPIRVGDRIKIEKIGNHWGGWGDVVDIGLRRTAIRNTDGVYVNYPNAVLSNSVITNFSQEDGPIRVRIRFQIDYDADLELMKKVVKSAIESSKKVLSGSGQVLLRSVDDSGGRMLTGVLVEARYQIEDVRDRTRIRGVVLEKILTHLFEFCPY